MPRVKLPADFKKAVSQMPDKDKDKLLFRLLAKEPALVEKLAFELMEGGETTEERRADIQRDIEKHLKLYQQYFYTPGYLLMELRSISGEITRHVKTTKDKYGEVQLNLFMLNKCLELFNEKVIPFDSMRSRTFDEYVVKRTLKIYDLLGKLHEDYVADFKTDLQNLGEEFGKNHTLMKTAIRHMLDVNWLLKGILPDY